MSSGAAWIEALVWTTLWQSSAWLLGGLALAALLARRPGRAHGVLLAAIAGAVATPLLGALFRLAGWGLLPGTSEFVGLAELAAQLAGSDGPPVPALVISWWHALATAWLLATAVALTRLAVSARRGRRLLEAAAPVRDPACVAVAREAARRMALEHVPTLLESHDVRCPVVWCWGGRPRLVLPVGLLDARRDEILGVLCHELAHFRRRDHLAGLAAEIASCLLPWNPLTWVVLRRLHELSEHCCDSWVLAAGESATGYAEVLLDLVPQRRLAIVPGAASGRRAVMRRIRRILEAGPCEPRAGGPWTTTLALLAALLVTTASLAHRRPPTVEVVTESGDTAPLVGPDVITIPAELDLGVAAPGAPVTREVLLCNRSERPRGVFEAMTSCGCTSVTEFDPRTLGPGECMKVEVTMTAPTAPGTTNTRHVTFDIEGQSPLKLPVHLRAARP